MSGAEKKMGEAALRSAISNYPSLTRDILRGRFAVNGEDEMGSCVPIQDSYLVRPNCGVAQLVAHRAHNPGVGSSSLPPATKTSSDHGLPNRTTIKRH